MLTERVLSEQVCMGDPRWRYLLWWIKIPLSVIKDFISNGPATEMDYISYHLWKGLHLPESGFWNRP